MRIQNSFSLNMVSKSQKSLELLGLGFCHMVNSDDPPNYCASLQSYYSHCKASREPQATSEKPVAIKFSRPDFPTTLTPERKLRADAKISGIRFLTGLHAQVHKPSLSLTRRRVIASPVAVLHHLSHLSSIY